mmetsp:Transcript_57717/g.182841  ORF Transcript_57717/g.182841 Transcript_57717/m.182841 type:complete len:412 (+) Transcript_57717:454-1689(+)
MQLRAHLCDPSQTTSRKHAPPAALLPINNRTPAPAVTPGVGDRRPAETGYRRRHFMGLLYSSYSRQRQARQAGIKPPPGHRSPSQALGGIAMTRVDPASMPAAGLCRARDPARTGQGTPETTHTTSSVQAPLSSMLPSIEQASPSRRPVWSFCPTFVDDIDGARPKSRPGYAGVRGTCREVNPVHPVYSLPSPAGGRVEGDSWLNRQMSPSKDYATGHRRQGMADSGFARHSHLSIKDIPGTSPKPRTFTRVAGFDQLNVSDIPGASPRRLHVPHEAAKDPRPGLDVGRLGRWGLSGDTGGFTRPGVQRSVRANPTAPRYRYDPETQRYWEDQTAGKMARVPGLRRIPHSSKQVEGEIEGRMEELHKAPPRAGATSPKKFSRKVGLSYHDRVLPPGPAAGCLPIPVGAGTW